METKLLFCSGIKVLGTLLCVLGFVINSKEIIKNYFNGAKVVSQNVELRNTAVLPSITICNNTAFKTPINTYAHLKMDSFLNNTLSMDEFLVKPYFTACNNEKERDDDLFSITYINSYYHGRCYTFDFKKEVFPC